jgi:hypothetical protein
VAKKLLCSETGLEEAMVKNYKNAPAMETVTGAYNLSEAQTFIRLGYDESNKFGPGKKLRQVATSGTTHSRTLSGSFDVRTSTLHPMQYKS